MKIYIRFLLISAAASVITALPDVGIFVAVLTAGLGLFLPSITYYLIAVIPGVALGSKTGNRLLGAAFSLVCIALAAFLPTLPDLLRENSFENGLIDAKIITSFKTPPRTIEIVRPERFKQKLGVTSYPEKTCNDICRHLIESGQVDWVRFRIEKERGGNEIIFFHAGKSDAECRVTGTNLTKIPCVLVEQNHGVEAELLIQAEFSLGEGQSVIRSQTDDRFLGWLNYLAISNKDGERKTVYSNVQQSLLSPVHPFALVIKFGPSTWESGGIEIRKMPKILNPVDYVSMLIDLGYELPTNLSSKPKSTQQSHQFEPNTDQTRLLLSVLDLPSDSKFNESQMTIINQWILHARQYEEWSTERVELVKRIYQDFRIGKVTSFTQIATKDQVSEILLPLALKQLKNSKHSSQMEQVLRGIPLMDKSIVQASKSTIENLLDAKSNKQFYNKLIFAGARAAIDPAPYLDQVEHNLLSLKIQAYCYLEPIGNTKSLQVLRSILSAPKSRSNGEWPDKPTEQAFRALARHGDIDTVVQIVKNSEWDHKKSIIKRSQNKVDDWRIKIYRACRS